MQFDRQSKMGLPFRTFIQSRQIWVCRVCKTHLADDRNLLSRNFIGRKGAAALFREA